MSIDQNSPSPRSPFCVRLTSEERTLLGTWATASGLSDGEYVRHQLFGADRTIRRTRGRNPVADQEALGQIISALGRTRAGSNLNQLAKSANGGYLVLDDDTRAALLEACADFRQMRDLLLKALGVRDGSRR